MEHANPDALKGYRPRLETKAFVDDIGVVMPALLNQTQLAEYLDKSEAWCERARWTGEGPPYCKIGRLVRYKAGDVMACFESSRRTSTSDNPTRRATAE